MKFTPFAKFKEQVIALAILVFLGLFAAGIGYGVIPEMVGNAIAAIVGAVVVAGFAIAILWPLTIRLGELLMGLGNALHIAGDFLFTVFEGGYENWKLLRHYRELYMDGFEAYVRKQNPPLARNIDWDVYR
jgi:hypothetical protein